MIPVQKLMNSMREIKVSYLERFCHLHHSYSHFTISIIMCNVHAHVLTHISPTHTHSSWFKVMKVLSTLGCLTVAVDLYPMGLIRRAQ